MPVVRPTRAAATWNTQNALSIGLIFDQLIHPHKVATPTLRLLLRHAQGDRLGPDMKFGWNVIFKHFSPSLAQKAQRWAAPGIDNITRMEYSPALQYNSAGTNDVDMALYDSDNARFDFIDTMVESMHEGYTDAFSYGLFSRWDEDITTGEVDISAALASAPVPPEDLFLRNVTAHTERMYSFPMMIKPAVNGHTLGNIPVTATTNKWWQPTVTIHSSATVTRGAAGADNADVILTVTNPQPIDLDDIGAHLDDMQLGWHYALYCACPAGIYRQLRAALLAITRRDIGSPLGELGIRAAIEWEEYNVIFYKEPMMSWLHPYSLFFWDPDCVFLLSDERFDPARGTGIYDWERVPGSNELATAMYHIVNLVCADRRGTSAMHGYTNS